MNNKDKFVELRQKAEKILQTKGVGISEEYSQDFEKLVEELNIAQIELEMQNHELQDAYQRLAIEQQKYKNLYIEAPVAYFTLNQTGNIIELNKAAAELLKLPIQQYRYTSIFPYIAEHSKGKFVKSFRQFFLSETTEYGEITFIGKDNNFVYTKLSAVCYNDPDLGERLCRCAVTDITEIKLFKEELKLQQQLRESEEKQKILIDNSFDIVNILDETGLIISENKATKRILGYQAGARVGLNAQEFVHPDDLSIVGKVFNELVSNPFDHKVVEYRFKHNNGHWVWLESSGQNFLADPVINGIIINSRDVSERKKAEEKLLQERQEFLALLNAIPEPIYVSDFDTFEVLFANETKLKLYGNSVIGDKCYAAFNKEAQQCSFCKNNLLMSKENDIVRWEKYDPFQDKYFLNIDKAMLWHNDKKVRFQISFDITEQKKALEKIEELNKRLEEAMNAGQMAWWDMKYPSGEVSFNKLKTAMLGYQSENFKHYTDFTNLVHPDDYEAMMTSMRNHLEGKTKVYLSEYRIRKADGDYAWYYDIGTKQGNNKDQFKITGIVLNTTERKMVLQKLQESEIRFKTLSNLTFEGIVLHQNGFAIDVNESFLNLSGFSLEEIIGADLMQIIVHPDYYQIVQQKMAEDYSGTYEILALKKDGSAAPVELEARNVVIEGSKVRVVAVRDIAERIKARDIIQQQTNKLQKLNNDKDRFMQIMAHDLKNPFNLLIGFSGILLRNFRKYDEKGIEEKLHIISDISNKTYNLLEELLVWSKAQSGILPFEPVVLNLDVVCNDVISGLTQNALRKNIEVVCDNLSDKKVTADYNMLKTILRNLISNAIKFTHQNGRIVISAEPIDNQWIIITVTDNGMGIEKQNISKLFNINQNISTQGTDGENGTGLGLLLCKEFVDKHQGRIWAESELGKGAQFIFTMPIG